MISAALCRAARSLLGWTQDDLARAADVSPSTIYKFEAQGVAPHKATVAVLKLAFEVAGVRFLPDEGDGPGLRLVRPTQRRAERKAEAVEKAEPVAERPKRQRSRWAPKPSRATRRPR